MFSRPFTLRSRSFIISLFLSCSPPTVTRLVIAVVIYTINTRARWSRPHIGKERLEIAPGIADPYTSATPVFVSWVARVLAALQHAFPSLVLWRTLQPVDRARFIEVASAAFDCAVSQVSDAYDSLFAAIAAAFPIPQAKSVLMRPFQRDEPTVTVVSYVYRFCHHFPLDVGSPRPTDDSGSCLRLTNRTPSTSTARQAFPFPGPAHRLYTWFASILWPLWRQESRLIRAFQIGFHCREFRIRCCNPSVLDFHVGV